MTTIAWDGKVLAGDSLFTCAGYLYNYMRKIHRLRDGSYMGFTGEGRYMEAMKDWLNGDRKECPTGEFCCIHVSADGKKAVEYEEGPYRTKVKAPYAVGSGGNIAHGLMLAKVGAKEAVRIACKIDRHSGGKIHAVGVKKKK